MTIKSILDEIAAESSTNKKMEILKKYKDNETLVNVLYLANSKRIKFYIKQIPEYERDLNGGWYLDTALDHLTLLHSRTLTGHVAVEHLKQTLSLLTPDDAYIIERIIDKDLKIGMGATQINKVILNLIEKTPYMGALSFDQKRVVKLLEEGELSSQIKMDGRYANVIVRGGDVEIESRSGEPSFLQNAKFVRELSNLLADDYVLNGELTINGISRYESNGIIASLVSISKKISLNEDISKEIVKFEKKHNTGYQDALDSIIYTVWDIIDVNEYFDMKSNTSYSERLNKLKGLFGLDSGVNNVRIIDNKIVSTYEEVVEHFLTALSKGEEGTILKSLKAGWKNGKGAHQIKFKLEMNVDLKIVGYNYGTKGTKNEHVISSLNVQSECGKVFTRPQGLTEEMMTYITDNQDTLLGTIVEVKCCGLSNDIKGNYSLLHPTFVCLRDDKTEGDTLESIIEIENMVKTLK